MGNAPASLIIIYKITFLQQGILSNKVFKSLTIIIVYGIMCLLICIIVAGEPTNLIAESNSTHVTVVWKSPGDPVTGYVIYYQSEGGDNSSDIVSGGETESHSLDCLESGVIYYISIVALSSTKSTSWTCCS